MGKEAENSTVNRLLILQIVGSEQARPSTAVGVLTFSPYAGCSLVIRQLGRDFEVFVIMSAGCTCRGSRIGGKVETRLTQG